MQVTQELTHLAGRKRLRGESSEDAQVVPVLIAVGPDSGASLSPALQAGAPPSSCSPPVLQAVALLEDFRGLDRDVEGSAKQWKKWVESECPEKEKLPQEWKKKSLIQKLIILRALRPDRMAYALR